ncbi:MAG TPA: LacI family transcriptional regulator, partial [Syntrophobacteraceae bacterium]|nr:LacI family transcriptional regulator [Syntrophobacteraceae bacterium]
STATVSRVLNATGPVDEETASHVRASVEALNYVPHAAARTLASSRTNTIGLLLPEISGAFFQPMLRGVETAASEAGYDLLVHTTRNPETVNAPRRPLAEHNTDGLLVFT